MEQGTVARQFAGELVVRNQLKVGSSGSAVLAGDAEAVVDYLDILGDEMAEFSSELGSLAKNVTGLQAEA